jgi:membrane protein required for colicin V production
MNWLDIVIAIPLLWGAYQGFKKGIIYMVLMIIGMVLGLYIAFKFSGLIVDMLSKSINASQDLLPYIAFGIVFACIVLLVLALTKFLEAILKAASLTNLNKVAGSLLGMAQWALLVSVLLWLLKSFEPKFYIIPAKIQTESITYTPVLKFSTFITPTLKEIKNEFSNNIGKLDSTMVKNQPDTVN